MLKMNANELIKYMRNRQYKDDAHWKADVYHLRTELTDQKVSHSTASAQLILDQCPPLKGDAKTVGTFKYFSGDHYILPVEAINYQLTVKVQNPLTEDQNLSLVVNELPVKNFTLPANKLVTITTNVYLTKHVLDFTLVKKAGQISQFKLVELSLKREQMQPLKFPQVMILSDSTAQTYSREEYPQTGWGAVLYRYIFPNGQAVVDRDPDTDYHTGFRYRNGQLMIINRSIGGRSAKSFILEGKLSQAVAHIHPHDYVLIQFGDNDDTSYRPMRYVPLDQVNYFMRQYIEAVRDREAIPILITPPSQYRPHPLAEGGFEIGFAKRRQLILNLAKDEGVKVIDLGAMTKQLLDHFGPDVGQALFLRFPAGQYTSHPEGIQDRTHFNYVGASMVARLVAQQFTRMQTDYSLRPLKIATTLDKPQGLTAKIEQDGRLTIHWERVSKSLFYYVTRQVANQENQGFITLSNHLADDHPCLNPTYQVCAYNENAVSQSATIHVPLAKLIKKPNTIRGVNVYEVSRDPEKIHFSLRFIVSPDISQYLITAINLVNGRRVDLDKISSNDVEKLHSYQLPIDGQWVIQVSGHDNRQEELLISKAVSVY